MAFLANYISIGGMTKVLCGGKSQLPGRTVVPQLPFFSLACHDPELKVSLNRMKLIAQRPWGGEGRGQNSSTLDTLSRGKSSVQLFVRCGH